MHRRYKNLILLLLFFLVFTSNIISQGTNFRFEKLTEEDGYPRSAVYDIIQDSRGFLWFGTLVGLCRYDGFPFKTYLHNPNNDRSISNIVVNSVYEDTQGFIWVGTLGGLNKFNRDTEQFTRYIKDTKNQTSISNDNVYKVYEDKKGILWIGTDGGGLNKFDRETEEFTSYIYDPDDSSSISHNSIFYAILESSTGELWIGTYGGGLNKFNKETGQFTHYIHDPDNPKSLSNDKIRTMIEDRFGNIWIGTENGLNRLILSENEKNPPTFIHYRRNPENPNSISGNRVFSIYEDKKGELWVVTFDGGVDKFNRNNETFTKYLYNGGRSIYQDNSGILWVGNDQGVEKLNPNKLSFKHYKHNPMNPKSLRGNTIFEFLEDTDKNIWVATTFGLDKFLIEKNEFMHINFGEYKFGELSNGVLSLHKDKLGRLWVGTWGRGLIYIESEEQNKTSPKFTEFMNNPRDTTSICGDVVMALYEDESGMLWIGTEDGGVSKLALYSDNLSKPKFINYKNDPNNHTSLTSNRVYDIYGDRSNEIWFLTMNGLDKFDKNRNVFIHYVHKNDDPQSLSSNDILGVFEDKSGNFWVGTTSGLNQFDRETQESIKYTHLDGLPSDITIGIREDDSGNLWISTEKGLSKFNPASKSFINYNAKDGLQGNEFNQLSYLRSQDGALFFGGLNGFSMFHPDSIKENTRIPQIVFTEFQLNNITVPIGFDSTSNRTVLKNSITETKEIELYHNDRVISFGFAALDFHNPEKNKYAYLLAGFEDDWNYTDASRRHITYTNLDPGTYILKIKGSNNYGYWNEGGASIRIIIFPPWWQTTWAYIIYALIILSIIYFTWRLQLRRIRIKHDYEMSKFEAEKMHEVDEMKSRFFANISHEFRTPLTLIFGPAKDISEKTKEQDTKQNAGLIKRNASRLYGLVNQLLDLSKLEAGRMTLETTEQNIIPLLKGLVLSFTSLAERKKITLKFNTIEENLDVYVDKDKVEKIINNLLSNAFKFTPEGGNIDFTVEKMINEVEMRIADNGIGISKQRIDKVFDRFYQVDESHTRESEGTGIGLALTKELVELHKGKIKAESKEGEGTTLTVQLPLGKDHLKPEDIVERKVKTETEVTEEETELIPETDNRKEKTDVDVLLDTDKPLLLIVEDNSDVRKYIISHLESDYRIQEAVDGEDGLEQAMNHIPDLIISDVMMPKMDGFELCNKLKTDERTSHIPIIMLTAKATSQDKIEGYETGADDYIMKPFDATELKARIKNLIDIRIKLHEKFSSDDYSIPKELNSIDEQFIKRVLGVINEHISEEEFSIEELGKESAMSRAQMYKKIKALTGKSPSLFLRSVRLSKAKKMIKVGKGTISEIAYSVGYSSPAYFTKCFSDEFGYSPSDTHKS